MCGLQECVFSFSLERNSYWMIERHYAIMTELNAGLQGEGMRVWKLAGSRSARTLLPGQKYEEAAQVYKGNFYRNSETPAGPGNSWRNHKYHNRNEAKRTGLKQQWPYEYGDVLASPRVDQWPRTRRGDVPFRGCSSKWRTARSTCLPQLHWYCFIATNLDATPGRWETGGPEWLHWISVAESGLKLLWHWFHGLDSCVLNRSAHQLDHFPIQMRAVPEERRQWGRACKAQKYSLFVVHTVCSQSGWRMATSLAILYSWAEPELLLWNGGCIWVSQGDW